MLHINGNATQVARAKDYVRFVTQQVHPTS